MPRSLVIVESPAKARTIARFLGSDFRVEASIGHVRDLPRKASEVPSKWRGRPWARLGVDVENGFAPIYIVLPEKRQQVAKLKAALAEADELYLATDEDREGESISWHLIEVLRPKVPVRRLAFHEITERAIREALAHPRDIDQRLVQAQETRRILDRLFGYEVSPLLWRKVRPRLSAGRVQSVAVRLVVERERERMAFVPATWWDVLARMAPAPGGTPFEAELETWRGRTVARGRSFDARGRLKNPDQVVLDEAAARSVVAEVLGREAVVSAATEKPFRQSPAPPFTTSTLQQEANRKLRWSARRTMQVAQRLYETGWITYMRTDSTNLSDEALEAARTLIAATYGPEHLPRQPRTYRSKARNAQEAHEAIRPAGARFRALDEAARELDSDARRLYELIWKRTVACQMKDARGRRMELRIQVGGAGFLARGRVFDYPGFRLAYVEGSDQPESELAEADRLLPPLAEGDRVEVREAEPRDHTTRPPPRLTEAALVKELERRGIGRPSTYATIIETILARDYVFKKGSALVPTFTAFSVTDLLERHLGWLVDYEFTAQMEDELDQIALGRRDPKDYLRRFYEAGDRRVPGLKPKLAEVAEQIDPREVCTIPVGEVDGTQVVVRVGRYGPYIEAGDRRADLPEDLAPDELTEERIRALLDERANGPRVLGTDPESGLPVLLMNGRFGPYVQLGEAGEAGDKPRRTSLLKGMDPAEVDLEAALRLLALPRELGAHPESGEPVTVHNGRFGPYVRCGKTTRTIPEPVRALDLTLDEAVAILAAPARGRRTRPEPLRELGEDPATGRTIRLMAGRYGPYVTDGEVNATIPRGTDPDALGLDDALALIEKKRNAPARPRRRASAGRSRSGASAGRKAGAGGAARKKKA